MLGLAVGTLTVTRNMQKIEKIALDTQATSRMMAIAAYTGAGKTTALERVAYGIGQENIFYVLVDKLMGVYIQQWWH